jgi:hypothetical protein
MFDILNKIRDELFGKRTGSQADFEQGILATGAVISAGTCFLGTVTRHTPILVPNTSFLASLGRDAAVPSPIPVEVWKFGHDYYFVSNDGFLVKTTVSI